MLLKTKNKKIRLSIKLLFCLIAISCKTKKQTEQKIIGNQFVSKSENRVLTLEILDEKTLRIENEFKCTNIPTEHRIKSFYKEYYISNNKNIVLKDSIFDLNLPYFNNSNCEFLSKDYRTKKNERAFDGRLIIKNRKELYTIPNIDTLKLLESNLIYYKNKINGSEGLIFKRIN